MGAGPVGACGQLPGCGRGRDTRGAREAVWPTMRRGLVHVLAWTLATGAAVTLSWWGVHTVMAGTAHDPPRAPPPTAAAGATQGAETPGPPRPPEPPAPAGGPGPPPRGPPPRAPP